MLGPGSSAESSKARLYKGRVPAASTCREDLRVSTGCANLVVLL